jgi:hypothetical protein
MGFSELVASYGEGIIETVVDFIQKSPMVTRDKVWPLPDRDDLMIRMDLCYDCCCSTTSPDAQEMASILIVYAWFLYDHKKELYQEMYFVVPIRENAILPCLEDIVLISPIRIIPPLGYTLDTTWPGHPTARKALVEASIQQGAEKTGHTPQQIIMYDVDKGDPAHAWATRLMDDMATFVLNAAAADGARVHVDRGESSVSVLIY